MQAGPGPDPRVLLLATVQGDLPIRTSVPLPAGVSLTVEVARTPTAQVTVRLRGALSDETTGFVPLAALRPVANSPTSP